MRDDKTLKHQDECDVEIGEKESIFQVLYSLMTKACGLRAS